MYVFFQIRAIIGGKEERKMSKILFVEDNEKIIMGIEYLFQQEGFSFAVAKKKKEALGLLEKDSFDLAILDISLPDGSGFELCKTIKEQYKLAVIFLTAREEEADVVEGFDLGAEDYIMKPFRNRELVSRMKAVLRRNGKDIQELVCGNVRIDLISGKVYREKQEVVLTKLEYKILVNLFRNKKRLITREEILNDIWDIAGNFVNDNTLTVYIKRIREKIGDTEGKIIQTVRGLGYRVGEEE